MSDDTEMEDLEQQRARNKVASALFGTKYTPLRIGRFIVLSELGRGSMGVVYSAFDEELNRKVAIKLLRLGQESSSVEQDRLRHEARAMARLSHPNVVHVYDVGEQAHQIFVAMEYAEGGTLRGWLNRGPHLWKERLRILVAAGRGLAAAHAAGLVHRDFKPENVLLDAGGEAKIADFGLTSTREDTVDETAEGPAATLELPLTSFTWMGKTAGTPAYMSPEQWEGTRVDERSDQFAYCVTCFEAFYGKRPFAGKTIAELKNAVLTGSIEKIEDTRGVPDAIRRALLRGLSHDPSDRHSSIDDILDVLARYPRRVRSLWAVGGTIGAVAFAAAMLATGTRDECTGGQAVMDEIWNDAKKSSIEEAFVATAGNYAKRLLSNTVGRLDSFASNWVDTHREACESTRRGESSAEQLELTMACLDRLALGAKALIGELENATPSVMERAPSAVASLKSADRCRDSVALSTWLRPPDDPELRPIADGIRNELTRAKALGDLGLYERGIKQAADIARRATKTSYAPILSEALLLLGDLQERTGDTEESIETLTKALRHAQASRHLEVFVQAASDLAYSVGYRKQNAAEAMRLLDIGQGALDALGGYSRLAAELQNSRGSVLMAQGKYQDAAEAFQKAIEAQEKDRGSAGVKYETLANLGAALHHLGRYDESDEFLERALSALQASVGPNHVEASSIMLSLGNNELARGNTKNAEARYREAIAIARPSLSNDHGDLPALFMGLSITLSMQGSHEEALDWMQEAIDILEHNENPGSARLAIALDNKASILSALDREEEAIVLIRKSIAGLEEVFGKDHLQLAANYGNLGLSLETVGNSGEAALAFQRALEIREANPPIDHAKALANRRSLGRALIHSGRVDAGLEELNRAQEIASRTESLEPYEKGKTSFTLAEALWDAKRDRKRARELAQSAREQFQKSEESKEELAKADEWLASR